MVDPFLLGLVLGLLIGAGAALAGVVIVTRSPPREPPPAPKRFEDRG